jgi:hypothetical protein
MADHGQVEYAVATGNDIAAHEATYENFIHLAFVGTLFVLNLVIGLAIGGVRGSWGIAFAIVVFSAIVAAHGLATGARAPIAVMLVLSLLALLLA